MLNTALSEHIPCLDREMLAEVFGRSIERWRARGFDRHYSGRIDGPTTVPAHIQGMPRLVMQLAFSA